MYWILFMISAFIRFAFISTIDKKTIRNILITNNVFNIHREYRLFFEKYYYLKTLIKIIGLPLILIYIYIQPILVIDTAITYSTSEFSFNDVLLFFIQHPLAIPKYHLCFYSGYVIEEFNISTFYLHGFFNKISWHTIFLMNNINVPNLYGYLINGKVILTGHMNKNDIPNSIIKPFYGYQGRGIELYDNDKDYSGYTDYIIQRKLQFDNYNCPAHLRCITCYKNSIIEVYKLQMFVYNKKNALTSNPGIIHEIDIESNKMRPLNKMQWIDTKIDKKNIDICIKDSIKLHNYFVDNDIFLYSLAFDIMICNDICYFLEGNIFHGTVFPYDKLFIKNAKLYLGKVI
jgi:hypothetical protein